MREGEQPAGPPFALPRGYRVERIVLTCDADTAGGWRGADPAPRLDVEFVWNGGYFARIRGASWFPLDSAAELGAFLDSVCRHNDREEQS